MPSVTDLLNDSLGQIGEQPITAIDDGLNNANYCGRFYPSLLDSALQAHDWKFAQAQAELAQDTATPLYNYSYSFALPSDYLKMVQYNGWAVPWGSRFKRFGAHLYTNDSQVYLTYIQRITDPNLWSPMFYQYLAAHLASKLCNAIPKDSKKAAELLDEALGLRSGSGGLLALAIAVDSQEQPPQEIRSRSLIWGRNPLGRPDMATVPLGGQIVLP